MKHCLERQCAQPCSASQQRAAGEAHLEAKGVWASRGETELAPCCWLKNGAGAKETALQVKVLHSQRMWHWQVFFPLLVLLMSFGPEFWVERSNYLLSFPVCLWPPALTGVERVGKRILPYVTFYLK